MLTAPDAIARCVADVEALCRDDQTEGWIVETVQIGERNEGRVIGAGGCVIRDLEARTGCSVRVQKGEGTCTIRGRTTSGLRDDEVYKACEAVRGRPGERIPAANADNVVESLRVPPRRTRRLTSEREHPAHKGRVRRARAGDEETEEAVVTGSREKAAAAVAMIGEILATMRYRPHEMHGAPPEAQARYAAQAPDGEEARGARTGRRRRRSGRRSARTRRRRCLVRLTPARSSARGAPPSARFPKKTGARLVVKGN